MNKLRMYCLAFGCGQLVVLALAMLPRETAREVLQVMVPAASFLFAALGCVIVARRAWR